MKFASRPLIPTIGKMWRPKFPDWQRRSGGWTGFALDGAHQRVLLPLECGGLDDHDLWIERARRAQVRVIGERRDLCAAAAQGAVTVSHA